VIDLAHERTVSIREVCRLIPGRGGRPIAFSTVWRWILQGVATPTGLVQLEAVRLGSRWITSREAIQRFSEALTPAPARPGPSHRTPRRRQRASERAARDLERAGI
jgi:hypothetical protein